VSSPTARTLAELRRLGWTAQVVEHWNAYARRRIDLGGGIDVVAWHGPNLSTFAHGGILGVQACAGASHAARRDKLLALPAMREWVAAGGLLEIWSWAKQGARGKRKVWTLRRESLDLAMFQPAWRALVAQAEQPREAIT
jgi:hypothetical protein